ncbi:hypothetical protein D9M72_392620 [compost metagenome]
MPLPSGSLRSEAMPPPPSACSQTKLKAWMPGTSWRVTRPCTRCASHAATRASVSCARSSGSSSGWRAMTPMFEVSPLSPLRAHARRISGTSMASSPGVARGSSSLARTAGGSSLVACVAGTSTACPSTRTCGLTRALSSRNAYCRIDGDTEARPPPAPVVPGAHEVPAGATSRANSSSASLRGCVTASRSTASRICCACVCACGP